MSVSKIEAVIEKLKAICERHRPTISYIFYFPWKNGPQYVCAIRKPSKKFALIAHIIRSGGKLIEPVKAHLEKNDPMDVEEDGKHSADYEKLFASVQEALVGHCDNCREKWKLNVLADGISNPDIESWNDYVREVILLRTTIEKTQFCINVEEHFPQKDDLFEYGSEYIMRTEEMLSIFEFLGETTYYFAAEYWERLDQKMTIYKSAHGEDMPGTKYLNEEF